MRKNIRCCAQCRCLNHRALLLQIQISPELKLVVNAGLQARSLYLCPQHNCVQRAAKNKHILQKLKQIEQAQWQQFCRESLSQLIA